MRLAVLVHWNEGEDSGVFKKIVSQVRTWKIQGIQTSVHIVSREGNFDAWQRHLGNHLLTFHYYRRVTRFRAWKEAVDTIFAQEPDLVYHRYDLYMPSIGDLAKRLPLVLEINTDDLKEYCLSRGLRCWYNRLTRGLLLHKVAGMVFVTHELSQLPHFARFRKPFTVIGNGIALQDYPLLPPPNTQVPRLVFVGTGNQPWQGIDKVLQLAQHFPRWHFDLVGPSPDQIKQILPNVFVYGRLSQKEYEPILERAHVALGSLALHRNGMEEGSPLKVREYLAYGLPVIIGYKDTDFSSDVPFILRLPNSENNIKTNLSVIETFVYRWMNQRVPREAIAHLDVKVKESRRIAFFQEMLKKRC